MKLFPFHKFVFYTIALILVILLPACGVAGVEIVTPTAITPTEALATASPVPTATPTIAPTETPTQTATNVPTIALNSTSTVDISFIHMIDGSNGWGIGKSLGGSSDMILTTLDGAKTWTNVTPSHAFDSIGPNNKSAIGYFSGTNNAWVFYFNTDMTLLGSTSAVVWRTTDGGQTWSSGQSLDQTNLQGAFFKPSDIDFSDGQHGWIMIHLDAGMMHDYVTIYATGDGGQTWNRVVDPSNTDQNALPQSFYKNGMVFLDANTGWIAGDYGGTMAGVFFYKTTDGGKTWSNQSLPAPTSMPDAFTSQNDACSAYPPQFMDANTGFMWVKCSDFSSSIPKATAWAYETTNDGIDWTALTALPKGIGSLFFLNSTTGWFMGATSTDPTQAQYDISRTTDGGKTWTELIKPNWSGTMDFISGQVGWIIATAGSDQTLAKALVQTTNGGSTWLQINPVVLTP